MWRKPWVQDLGLALVLLLACAAINEPDGPAAWWVATVLLAAGVALRRRWPVRMLGLCAVASAAHLELGEPVVIIDLATPILLYTVAVQRRLRVSLAALAVLMLGAIGWSVAEAIRDNPAEGLFGATDRVATVPIPPPAPRLRDPDGPAPARRQGPVDPADPAEPADPFGSDGPPGAVEVRPDDLGGGLSILGSVLIAAWAVGSSARGRRIYLERERDRQAEMGAAAERSRISRELHDVVAHGLSVMVVQAQGGAAALDNHPADTRAALEAIVQTGRRSLAEMRQVLGAVTQEPQPGLADLRRLAEQVSDAGVPVQVTMDPLPDELPSTVDFAAYRIVQEALTNTMKHAGAGAHARVHISLSGSRLRLRISDDGGSGLRGMRERAGQLGGQVTAGPSPEGGFVVDATLPLQGPEGTHQ